MTSETVKNRLAQLLRKSQKAVSLYSLSGSGEPGVQEKRFSTVQVRIWKLINQELSMALKNALSVSSTREVIYRCYTYRDRLYGEWRRHQSELFVKREQLMKAAEDDQFAKAAILSERLITVKAKMQATRAALHELGVALGDASYSSQGDPKGGWAIESAEEYLQQQGDSHSEDAMDESDTNVIPFDAPRRTRIS